MIHCNIFNNDYQRDLKLLFTFVLNQQFCQLLSISPNDFIFSRTFNLEILYIDAGFIDQDFKLLEIEGKAGVSLVKMTRRSIKPRDKKNILVKNYSLSETSLPDSSKEISNSSLI